MTGPAPQQEPPGVGGFYEIETLATGDRALCWVYVHPKSGSCVRRKGMLGSETIDGSWLKRHRWRGPVPIPDRMPGEL